MLIEGKPLQHWIDYFYGYGQWQANVWFVGYEESGGDLPEDVAEKLTYFSGTHASTTTPILCDMRDLYRQVTFRAEGPRGEKHATLYDYRFGSNAIIHGGWKNLIAFAHGFHGKKLPNLLTYQKNSFASSSKPSEAFLQLYPLPSTHNHAWYYSWLDLPQFPFLKSRTLYEEHFYQKRMQMILTSIRTHQPEVVLMYGMNNINELKKSVQAFFPQAVFTTMKGTKLEIPQHHRTDVNGTALVITTQVPTLRHNRIETGFDWEKFGRLVKQSRQ